AALPGYIVGASDWLRSIWDDRAAFTDKPALLLWGLKDIAFRRKELERWKSALSDHELHEFEDCGHFLAEEAPDGVASALRTFMGQT
ncbi:MAG: alpha/beta fold hydrolase, partial [Rhodospirillales bacterium]|nr:alpha/beta fold hydrolase [Rhodospirillales bacterium]